MTGWRLGYASGPKEIIAKMALVQDLLYVCPPSPLQKAAVTALQLGPEYYLEIKNEFTQKRDLVVNRLNAMGIKVSCPQGTYYLLDDISGLNIGDDVQVCDFFLESAGVALVPGRSFYTDPNNGKNWVRICFAMGYDILLDAMNCLEESLLKIHKKF